MTTEEIADLAAENLTLRAALRVVTDDFAQLLKDEKFPARGRSNDDRVQRWRAKII
jgi:hypothetical protein